MRAVRGMVSSVRGDTLLYAGSAVLAGSLAAVTIYHGHRVWGLVSAFAYAAAALAAVAFPSAAAPRRRMLVAAVVFVASALVPLAVLVAQRVHGVPWSAQPEVDVVERMARLLLDTGTPYAAAEGIVRFEDYSPYLPAMAIFGLPRAVFGESALTDARLAFLVVSALLVLVAVRQLGGGRLLGGRPLGGPAPPTQASGRPLPVRAVQLVAVLPATTLPVATGGDDLPVLALVLLVCVCCQVGRVGAAGAVGGLALAMKLTAAPVLLVLVVTLYHRAGARRAATFAAAALGVSAALVLPAALVSPSALVEHVIRFPAGLTGVASPAASPLPGHLLAETGPAGRVATLVLLAMAAVAVLVWVLRWPPRSAAQAAERAAVGLLIAMLLMPATRFGYLIYPLVLTGAAIALRSRETDQPPTSSWSGWLRRARAG